MNNRGWKGLPKFSKDLYQDSYFLEGEDYDAWIERVSSAYSDNESHKERIKSYLHNYWFHPSTPPSGNAGVPERGLPISCYTNSVPDTKEGIFGIWNENNWLGSLGGGIGTNWSDVRAIGEKVGAGGKSSGIIPFISVSDRATLAVSQGGRRRASQAVYLKDSHPEIEEFIDIRRPTGDALRRSPNIHHGVVLSDKFMEAVVNRDNWELISPKTKEVIKVIDAFDLFTKILTSRIEIGEPYIMFSDTVNRANPEEYKELERQVTTSNLCSEILLHTDEKNTGVCCLTSLNLEYYDEWKDNEMFIEDIHRFTDNILQSFIDLTEGLEGFDKARYSAIQERSIGIGYMGYHSLLQKRGLPYEALASYYLTEQIGKYVHRKLSKSNILLAKEKGTATISKTKRNVHTMAVAPTASISTLCNLTSQGIDPRISNVYTAKTKIGSYTIKNKFLEEVLEKHGMNTDDVWRDILQHQGSVQHLTWMSDEDREVFKTAYEINPFAIIRNISTLVPNVSQGISTNIFLPADTSKQVLYDVHIAAWEKGLKTLYYLRSKSINRASTGQVNRIELEKDTCIGCA